ncbi:unnamed protein product [Polarella glacialis]|uniref:Ubiquitin-like domain-containing protein n=1 Tax=Polarella glacialis TaxID=89957 RepID=A0A813LVV3_POLGL|nr:unnamed protein product [Polarella glacialis]
MTVAGVLTEVAARAKESGAPGCCMKLLLGDRVLASHLVLRDLDLEDGCALQLVKSQVRSFAPASPEAFAPASPEMMVKTMLTGDSGTGKSQLMNRFVRGQFTHEFISTLGADFLTKLLVVDNHQVFRMQIWDMSGLECFQTITCSYFREAGACLLVFNIADRNSFHHIPSWKQQLEEFGSESLMQCLVLVGTGADRGDRQVSEEEAWTLADELGCSYHEVSSKTGECVSEAFFAVADKYLNQSEART